MGSSDRGIGHMTAPGSSAVEAAEEARDTVDFDFFWRDSDAGDDEATLSGTADGFLSPGSASSAGSWVSFFAFFFARSCLFVSSLSLARSPRPSSYPFLPPHPQAKPLSISLVLPDGCCATPPILHLRPS